MKFLKLSSLFLLSAVASSAAFAKALEFKQVNGKYKFEQIAVDSNTLFLVDSKGTLYSYQANRFLELAKGFSTTARISAGAGRISGSNKTGNYIVYEDGNLQVANFKVAPDATMVQLDFATIVNLLDTKGNFLARIEYAKQPFIAAQRKDFKLLPDASPLHIDLDAHSRCTSCYGHIAVLGNPSPDLSHGALGDNIEAKSIYYVERHGLYNLANPITLPGTKVFEANSLLASNYKNKMSIATVISGDGNGGGLGIVTKSSKSLTVSGMSEPLASGRWMSPLKFANDLYAVKTPHLHGILVKYDLSSNPEQIAEAQQLKGVSNHSFKTLITNVSAPLGDKYLVLPNVAFDALKIIDMTTNEVQEKRLPARVKQLFAVDHKIFILTHNGTLFSLNL